ncbi:MAG: hypothetical protein M0P61_12435 [Ignavibacteriaceae bacterium]|jgi:hypothetical protein|nr:hypothetical protein [Ignavibacteriaceae bacterium]
MEERESSSLLIIAVAFLLGFILSLFRSEYFFGIISLGFSILVYSLGFILAKQKDSKDLSNQFEN